MTVRVVDFLVSNQPPHVLVIRRELRLAEDPLEEGGQSRVNSRVLKVSAADPPADHSDQRGVCSEVADQRAAAVALARVHGLF